MDEKELYTKELNQLIKESKNKDKDWLGWYKIERLEDILIKYKYKNVM
jgi:hypothetical protein